jgi:hypothetical protein
MRRIKTTIPRRTYRGTRSQPSSHAAYLRMAHLEMEKKRRNIEIKNGQARIKILTDRLKQIDQEMFLLQQQQPALVQVSDVIYDAAPAALMIKY